jgi:ABC-type antimicrobial peptide transport system permease subunit
MMHRNENYVNGWPHGSGIWAQQNRVNDMMYPFRHLAQYQFSSPFTIILEKMVYMNFTLDTLMFVINFIIILVDAIMIYTLFISDIEERTYEFAMLRTLGFQKHSLVILLTV